MGAWGTSVAVVVLATTLPERAPGMSALSRVGNALHRREACGTARGGACGTCSEETLHWRRRSDGGVGVLRARIHYAGAFSLSDLELGQEC